METDLLADFGNDAIALVLTVGLLAGYQAYLRRLGRMNPDAVLSTVAAVARSAWVETVMSDPENGVLAIQTLRNSTMAATFLASTSILLMVGVLTLSGQAPALKSTWHSLNLAGTLSPELWLIKLISLLLMLFFAFFCFSNAIRIFNHVGYMINVRDGPNARRFSPGQVAGELNRGGHYYHLGTRTYYFLVPLVFWLFGPTYMVASALLLVLVMLPRIDRTPRQVRAGRRGAAD